MIRNALQGVVGFFSRPRRLYIFVGVVIFCGFFFFTAAYLKGFKDTLVKELRDSAETVDRIKQNLMLLSQDSGEIRAALGLPPRSYPPLEYEEKTAAPSDREERNNEHILFYRAVEHLLSHTEKALLEREFLAAMESPPVATVLKKHGLVMKKAENGVVLEKKGIAYFTFSLGTGSSPYEVRTFTGRLFAFKPLDDGLREFIDREAEALSGHFTLLGERIRKLQDLIRSPEVQERLKKSDLVMAPPTETPESVSVSVALRSERNVPKLKLGLNKRDALFFIEAIRYEDPEEFRKALPESLERLDLRTTEELKVEGMSKIIRDLTEDRGFRSYLQSKKLRLSSAPREDSEYVYFDFLSPEGNRAGSLGIQRAHGEIYLFDEDDVSLGSLKTFSLRDSGTAKKKLDPPRSTLPTVGRYGNRFSHTFLVVGSHEKMTDTMILVHVDEIKNEVALLSLPRDLFFRGRKLNSIYVRYGADRLVEEISDLTGLTIERYIIIDMFAFIDAVNILGGIEITLDEDLVDPTYRIKEGGRWSTLFYSAGKHHLNGIEALRVARSRHFTSDFGRSRRQQFIISAIKDKLAGLGLGDLGKMYNLVQVLLKYVDTDLSPFEIVTYLSKYGGAHVASQVVVDTNNVLYHSYTNLKHMNLAEEEVDESFDKGAYILLPRDDDWNTIRWFIRSVLEGVGA